MIHAAFLPTANSWSPYLSQQLWISIRQTLYMVFVTLGLGGLIGLILGLALYATRKGGVLPNRYVYGILFAIINLIRPIPFIIFLTAVQPVTMHLVGTTLGSTAAIVPMVIMCSVATSRLVEQSLVGTDPGLIEAGRAMGASRVHILFRILVPEALSPLILGYAFLFIGILDMSAMAGAIGGGGLGNFAITNGYNLYNNLVTWVAVAIIIALVFIVQSVGNWLARIFLRR